MYNCSIQPECSQYMQKNIFCTKESEKLEKEILVFLKDNQNSWSLQNKNIYFTDQNVEREYYLLINKFSESEESVDL